MSTLPDPEDAIKRLLATRRTAMRLHEEFDSTGDESKRSAALDADQAWTAASQDVGALMQAGLIRRDDIHADTPGSTLFAPEANIPED